MSELKTSGNSECEVIRETEIQTWMQRLENELCRGTEMHNAIRDCVCSVLRDAPPTEEEDKYPEEQLTPLAAQLRGYVRRLGELNAGYEHMVSRIEL